MKNLTILSFVAMLLITSCAKSRLTPNGNIITEIRDVKDFTGINTDAANTVHITYGSNFKVEIKGSNNLVPHFKSYVNNKELQIKFEDVVVNRDDIEVFITMPELMHIALSGNGKIYIDGVFQQSNSMYFELSGNGKISFSDYNTVNFLDVNIFGSADALLEKLTCKHADISISGSGKARVAVDEYLKASISGSGKIYYTGSPIVNPQVSGSGEVIKY